MVLPKEGIETADWAVAAALSAVFMSNERSGALNTTGKQVRHSGTQVQR